jgi:hypothetical protein
MRELRTRPTSADTPGHLRRGLVEWARGPYGNGSALGAVGRDASGAVVSQTWRTADGSNVVSEVTRSRAGTITDESLAGVDARPCAANFGYDAVGRLVDAWVPGHRYAGSSVAVIQVCGPQSVLSPATNRS